MTKLVKPGLMILVAIVAAFGLFASPASAQLFDFGKMISPGDLAKSHAEVEGLDNCQKCHTLREGIPDKNCLDCHKDVKARNDAKKGWHSTVTDKCVKCHSDHKGKTFKMIVLDTKDYDHKKTGYELSGKHLKASCEKCHTAKIKKTEYTSYFLDQSTCIACHKADDDKSHKGTLGSDCAKCHTAASYKRPDLKFEHDKDSKYPLQGKHAQVKCESCHPKADQFKLPGKQNCVDCHEKDDQKAHKGSLGTDCAKCHVVNSWKEVKMDHNKTKYPLLGKHIDVKCQKCHEPGKKYKADEYDNCVDCHKKDDEKAHNGKLGTNCEQCHSVKGWKALVFDHTKAKYKLEGRHKDTECAKCHPNQKWTGLQFATCNGAGCHDTKERGDVHGTQFKGRDCNQCHTLKGWKPSEFKHESPEYKGYKLQGKHATVECAKCHVKGLFKPIASATCNGAGCHDTKERGDVHGEQFKGKDCTECHNTNGWKPTTFAHEKPEYRGYRLIGKHAKVECKKCHIDGKYRPIESESCSTSNCHDTKERGNIHGNQFGGRACADCHTPDDWKTLKIDHNKQTRFPLVGKHVPAKCESCHPNKLWKPVKTECVACHEKDDEKAHKGKYGKKCEECHTAVTWEPMSYTHEETGFALEGAHRETRCSACHTVKGEFGGLSHLCGNCHTDPHWNQFGTDCEECHTARNWVPTLFDHNRTGFRLEGMHRAAVCEDCHHHRQYRGPLGECYDCHKDEFMSSHTSAHNPDNRHCGECHSSYAWQPATNFHHSVFTFTGQHLAIKGECDKCHMVPGYVLKYSATTEQDCAPCHQAQYSSAHTTCPQNCSLCHTTATFSGGSTVVPCN